MKGRHEGRILDVLGWSVLSSSGRGRFDSASADAGKSLPLLCIKHDAPPSSKAVCSRLFDPSSGYTIPMSAGCTEAACGSYSRAWPS